MEAQLLRRTRVVATIGPASSSPEVLDAMVAAGMDVARVSSAHDPVDVVLERVAAVQAAGRRAGVDVAVMVDLCGPKLRFSSCGDGVVVRPGDCWQIRHDAQVDEANRVLGAALPVQVWERLEPGTLISVGDGAVQFTVLDQLDSGVTCSALSGGMMRGRPGLHVPSDLVDVPSPTGEDLEVAAAVVEAGVDAVAVSFVRRGADLARVRRLLADQLLVAKIETAGAVRNLSEVISAADAVMVARGDLGLEFPAAEVPFLQKRIVAEAIAACRPVVTATQMLESMVSSPVPTRAEAADVATAVLDGTSAVMLSGETAVGADPVLATATMAQIAARADREVVQRVALPVPSPDDVHATVTHAVSASAPLVAAQVGAAAIVCLTERGFTARALSRWRPSLPLVAATRSERVVRQLRMSWGVTAALVDSDDVDAVLEQLVAAGALPSASLVVVMSGVPGARATDTLRVRRTPGR